MATNKKSTVKVADKIICDACGKSQSLPNYYKSDREEYSDLGYVPTCKKCLTSLIIDDNTNKITHDKFKYILKKVDRPFIESIFNEVAINENTTNLNFFGKYLSTLNLKPKYKNLKYADTVDIEIEQEKIKNSKIEEIQEVIVTEEMKRFWGRSLENVDYIDLQVMYDEYTSKEKNMTKKKLDDYKALCIYELQKTKIQFDLSRIADTQKLQGLIDNLSSNLGIQAIQKLDEEKNDRFTLGLLARYHEDVVKRPIRRFVEDLGGVDPIDKKIRLYYLGGILNAMGINDPNIEEYREEVDQYTVKIKEIEQEIREQMERDLDG